MFFLIKKIIDYFKIENLFVKMQTTLLEHLKVLMSSNTKNIPIRGRQQKKDYIRDTVVSPPKLVSGLQIKSENNNAFLIINFLETINNQEENSLMGSFVIPNKMAREIYSNLEKYINQLDGKDES